MKFRNEFSRHRKILMFALTVKAGMAAYFTILPLYLISQAFSPIKVGLLIGTGNFVAMILAPYGGATLNRTSNRNLLVVSGLATGFFLASFALVNSEVFAFIATILLTISNTFLRLGLLTAIAKIKSQRRASAMGWLNISNSLGSSLGFILSGWVADIKGYAMTFPISALPIILVSVFIWISSNWERKSVYISDDLHHHQSIQNLIQTPKKIVLPMLFLLCDMGITSAWQTYMPIYLVNYLGWSATLLGGLMATQTLVYLVCQPLTTYLADRTGYKPLLVVGLSSYGILVSLMALTSSIWLIFILMFLNAAFASPIYPTSLAMAAEVPPEERGTAMGFMLASSNLAGVLGPVIGGVIVSFLTIPTSGFAYSFIPALTVSVVGQLAFSRQTVNLPKPK